MIWLYILAAIVAQAIVVVLIVEYINRRSMPGEAANVETTSSEVEQKEPLPTEKKEEEAVGESSFSYEAFKAMQEDIRSLRECVETLMDAKDAEFDEPIQRRRNRKRKFPMPECPAKPRRRHGKTTVTRLSDLKKRMIQWHTPTSWLLVLTSIP